MALFGTTVRERAGFEREKSPFVEQPFVGLCGVSERERPRERKAERGSEGTTRGSREDHSL